MPEHDAAVGTRGIRRSCELKLSGAKRAPALPGLLGGAEYGGARRLQTYATVTPLL
jgi:hypothetical protein